MKKPYGECRVIFFCVGDGRKLLERFGTDPRKLFREDPIFKQIMLSLADGGLSLQNLSACLKLDENYTFKLLDRLKTYKLVFERDGSFFTTIPVLTANKSMQLIQSLNPIAKREADVIENEIDYIKKVILSLPLSRGFGWENLAHIVVDALILDLGTLHSLTLMEKKQGIYDLRTDWQKVIPFFGMENNPDLVPNLGVNSNRIDQFGLSFMHSTLFERKVDPFNVVKDHENKLLISVLFKGTKSLYELHAIVHEKTIENVLELNWVKCKDNECLLNLPLIRKADRKTLSKLVKSISDKVAKSIMDCMNIIQGSCETLGYSNWLQGVGDYLEVVYHMLMAYTTSELIKREVLPGIPEAVPPHWAVWMWELPWMLDSRAWES